MSLYMRPPRPLPYERLLDKNQQPLALFDSATQLPDSDFKPDLIWRGGYLCQQTFMPAALQYIDTKCRWLSHSLHQ